MPSALVRAMMVAVAQHAVLMGMASCLRHRGSTVAVDILLPGEGRQARYHDGGHHTGQADGQVEGGRTCAPASPGEITTDRR